MLVSAAFFVLYAMLLLAAMVFLYMKGRIIL
jgi:hypothetical protein